MSTTGERGAQAEALAAQFLARNGMRIIERNYRCRGGEIDLVARERDTLVFVEVRLRASSAFGGAGASIDAKKRRRIILAAQHYLMGRSAHNALPCRFDAILLSSASDAGIEWIKDAFSA